MKDHDAERIADAMHQLRPDWPASSLLTLIRKHLVDRPRRDVVVALGWVACEPNSHTPARVLESGPWWQAAAVETPTGPRPDKVEPGRRCTVCSEGHDRCRSLWTGDHEYTTPRETDPAWVAAHVAALRAELAPTSGPTERRTLEDLAAANPELHARVEAVRAAMPKPPPMRETDVSEES